MIASKQIAFGKAAGKPLPYDAEIEYLKSTGTQYIDTGIYVDNNLIVEGSIIVGDYTTFTTPRIILATDYTGSGYEFRVREPRDASRNTLQVMCGDWWTTNPTSGSLNAGSIASFRFDRDNRRFMVNGFQIITKTPLDYSQYRILIGHSMAGNYNTYPSSKIRTITLYIGDNLVCDFIPVRKGNVGYMYDKVSGQLFGNAGTGEFVLGPDIIDYTAKDYVQDGLVAMWDGIENAGWGVHDPSATVWKDLVGTRDFTLLKGSFSFLENCLRLSPNSCLVDGERMTSFLFVEMVVKRTSGIHFFSPYGNVLFRDWNCFGFNTDTSFYLKVGKAVNVNANSVNSISVSSPTENTLGDCYVNGAPSPIVNTTYENYQYDPQMGSKVGIGRSSYDSGFSGDIFNLRIYSRTLTAEEIAHNYEIDKARFGL